MRWLPAPELRDSTGVPVGAASATPPLTAAVLKVNEVAVGTVATVQVPFQNAASVPVTLES